MPQDKKRSISYRSFVTCDDPKGVVECGAIRKSKTSSFQKREQHISNKVVEDDKKQRNPNTSLAVTTIKEEKKEMGVTGITRELENSTSFQLLEVSKEAQKLNHVINSWSNGKAHQKDIAKDLLRGALDLQESLAMLGKLQETSSYMSGLSRKQKQKLQEGGFDGRVGGVRGSNEKLHMGFRWPRFSADGSLKKSSDEMKKVVRDSLLRQNMITNPIFEEHFDHRKMGSPDVMPSTSSSQSSMVYSSNFAPSDSSISSTGSQRNRGKGSNLIVKLMGLESLPSSPRKHREKERILNQAKPMYDIDSPRAKKPQFVAQKLGMKQRTVDEIFENLNFKGFLRDSSVNDLTMNSRVSEVLSPLKNCWVDKSERPPIVVMKPMHFPCLDLEEPIVPKFRGEALTKLKYGRGSDQETVENEATIFSEKYKVAGDDCEEKGTSVKKVASSKANVSVNQHLKPQKKQIAVRKASEVENVTRTRRNDEEKKDAKANKELRSRHQEKFITSKMKKKKEKNGVFDTKNHRKLETFESKKNRQRALVEENQRCKAENRGTEAIYKEDIDSTRDNNSVTATVNSIIVDNIDTERCAETCQIQIRDYDTDNRSHLFDTREGSAYLQNDKKISLCHIAPTAMHECGSEHHPDDNQSSFSEITSVSTSEHCNVDHLNENLASLHEVTLETTHENGVAVCHDTNEETDFRTKLKALLLSNPLFVNHVEELFDLQIHPNSVVPSASNEIVSDVANARVLIDCANEVMELKTSQFSLVYPRKPQSSPSLDRLLEEICNEIEDFRCYLKPENDSFSSDNLYFLLDRDLRYKSRTWEMGWRSLFSQDEVDQVVAQVEKLVLGKLIEEVLSDFML